jgi:hypothetical protein
LIESWKIDSNDGINGTIQMRFRKENWRELKITTKTFIHNKFQELLDWLLLRALNKSRLGDSWIIDSQIKVEHEPRHRVLLLMNEDKLKQDVNNYIVEE